MLDRGDESDSYDSLEEQLDQIGKLNINSLNLNLNYSRIQVTNYLSNLSNFDISSYKKIPDIGNEISKLVNGFLTPTNQSEETSQPRPLVDGLATDSEADSATDSGAGTSSVTSTKVANAIKTIISTRIQMNTILNDLNLGISLSSAVDRLQPLKDVIHEAVILPVEDDAMDVSYDPGTSHQSHDGDLGRSTEPQGIEAIITDVDKPFISDFVIPEEDLEENQITHSNRHRTHRHKHNHPRKRRKRSKRYTAENESLTANTSSDLDIEGLTLEETEELTNLNSLQDFYKQNVLRNKIQRIQGLKNINQALKNTLVTRLMMGNYYKYVNEKADHELPKFSGALKLQHDSRNSSDNLNTRFASNGEDRESSGESDQNREVSGESENGDEMDLGSLEESDGDEVILTEQDKEPSYYDKLQGILGCKHYQRNCKIECPTCLKWFTCRFCHDEQIKDHKLIRNEIKHILCMNCTTPQEPTEHECIECEKELSNYICFKCKLYDNDYKKDIYHCDKCGICRLGLGLGKDYFHCDECNICLSIDLKQNHKCLNNTTHCDCPICNEYLFTSVSKVVFMKCGHLIHENCYKEMTKHSYKCPICKKTIVNMETQFRILDQEIFQQPLPLPYKNWRCIISCNDCKGKSNVQYHLLGLKCKYCNSYNTNQIKMIKPEEEFIQEQEQQRETFESIDRMQLVQTNLSSNFRIDRDNDTSYTENDSGPTGSGARSTGTSPGPHKRTQIQDSDWDNEHYGDNEEEEGENDEDDNPDGANEQDLVNIKQFTNKLLNKKYNNNEVSYITSIFQKYINNTLKNIEQNDPKEME